MWVVPTKSKMAEERTSYEPTTESWVANSPTNLLHLGAYENVHADPCPASELYHAGLQECGGIKYIFTF